MQTTSRKLFTLIALAALLLSGAAIADASEKWIHVRVDSADGEKVTVNLPVALIGAAADMVPPELQQRINEETEIALDDVQMSWGDLRNFWEQVRDSPDATYVSIESERETIRVKREGDYLLIESDEGSETEINVTFPMAAVDALLSGPEGTLDFKAALQVLASEDHGHLVSVRDGNDTVRIWIDDKNTVD